MILSAPTLADINRAAEAAQPREMCGVIVRGKFIEIKNIAEDNRSFLMDPKDIIAKTKGKKVEAIVHSHVYEQPIASDADRTGCEQTGVPWVIFSWPNATYSVIEPCGFTAPLVGRDWCHGSHDCYGLLRDGFKAYTGIELPNFDRNWEWWKRGGNIIAEQFQDAGFTELDQGAKLEHCDVLILQFRSPVPNHCALFLKPEHILHHIYGRQSTMEIYGGFYQNATVLHLRHKGLMI